MKRRIAGIAVLGATMTVALLLPTAGTSAPPDVRGPKCADIFVHSPGYAGPQGGTALVTATVTTASASCPGGVYTASVYDASGTTLLGSQTFIGNGNADSFSVQISVNPAPSTVCLVVTSQVSSKAAVADRAPNAGCDPSTNLSLGSGGATGFG